MGLPVRRKAFTGQSCRGRGLPVQHLDLLKRARSVLNRAASRGPAVGVCRASQADRAVLERAGSREPANRGLAHTVGARQIGLHSAVSEPLESLLALVGCQLDRAAEFHASGLGALAAIVCSGADKLALELSKAAENGQQ